MNPHYETGAEGLKSVSERMREARALADRTGARVIHGRRTAAGAMELSPAPRTTPDDARRRHVEDLKRELGRRR